MPVRPSGDPTARLRLAALATVTLLVPLAPATTAARAAALVFTGIRPGTLLAFDAPSVRMHNCTADFVFQDTAGVFDPAAPLYIGTNGHCTDLGDTVKAIAIAPGTTTPVLVTVGTTVYDNDTAYDFALIAIDPAMNAWVSPSVAAWGGPTAAYSGPDSGTIVGTQVGYGGYAGGFVHRIGAIASPGGLAFTWNGAITFGDSGSPVTTFDGLAVGAISASNQAVAGAAAVNSYGPTVELMQTLTGKVLSTCPTRTPWPAPGCPPG